MASTTTTMSLKLLVDSNSNKVLFAEAGKDFIDFLLGLLELPLGSIMSLLVDNDMDGCESLGRVYRSVNNLDNSYMQQSNQTKQSLLTPKTNTSTTKQAPLLLELAYKNQVNANTSNSSYRSDAVDGYVKGVVTYMVMDDLVVKPMSTITSISLLNTLGIKDLGCLQEKTVEVDMAKGLKLVKASMESKTVLTDVFLPKKEI